MARQNSMVALDCPFCGDRPQLHDSHEGQLPFRVISGCGALGPDAPTRSGAVEAWNKRVDDNLLTPEEAQAVLDCDGDRIQVGEEGEALARGRAKLAKIASKR